jgi:hypothetical protein
MGLFSSKPAPKKGHEIVVQRGRTVRSGPVKGGDGSRQTIVGKNKNGGDDSRGPYRHNDQSRDFANYRRSGGQSEQAIKGAIAGPRWRGHLN